MPLRFLVPAFLAGLAALAIPVLVHLTRKRRAETMPFPSLMFLEKVPYREESRRRIHHWLLLLLRAAAVVLIVAAFARPLVDDPDLAAGATGGPREVVVLVDRSYSMAVGDHWERAVEAARVAVDDLGPLDRASVVFFDGGAEAAVRSSADPARLRAALDTAHLSDRATRYGPGLKLAQSILEESELPGRELVLVGDFQRAGWTGEEGVRLPAGTVVTPVPLAGEAPPNRAVADVQLARETFQGRERVVATARLTRTGGQEAEEVEVALEVDGREVDRSTVSMPPSGAVPVTFQPFTLAERHTRGTVRLPDDALPGDDAFHFVLSPGEALRVEILDDAGGDGASSLYLTRALRVSPGGGTGRSAFDVRVRRGGAVGAAEVADADVVIVNDRPVPPTSARALRDFVEGGGGLIVVLGERASWPAEVDAVLPGAPGPAADRGAGSAGGRGGRLGHLDYDHPVFEIFRGPRNGDFTGARFFRARALRVTDDPAVRVLARYDDGAAALVERTVGDGRVLVWTSTLDAYWNDLALQPVFLPFVHGMVRHASGRREALPAFTAGQVIDVSDARAMETAGLGETAEVLAAGEERVALTPRGASLTLAAQGGIEGVGPRFLELEERGFYRVRPPGADDVRPLAVAVNVDPGEADLTPLDPVEVAASLTVGQAGDAAAAPAREGAAAEGLRLEDRERRQSLWRFLLVGAFALLALETVLSNRVRGTRRTLARAEAGERI
ncbi:MAG: BatA domain-containing protein [Gemmatimonadota bacterium]|jgi:hypothetical protein